MPPVAPDAGELLANIRALEAAGADAIGVEGDSPEQWVQLGAIAAVTEKVWLLLSGTEPKAVGMLARGRAILAGTEDVAWTRIAVPPDRDGWLAMLREQEAAGAAGVIVPWDPRLIDLLRNPDPGDRSDLLMSTG